MLVERQTSRREDRYSSIRIKSNRQLRPSEIIIKNNTKSKTIAYEKIFFYKTIKNQQQ